MRTLTLFMLVSVDVIVAVLMLGSSALYVLRPDAGIKAGPMYVTLALTTIAAVLMAYLAVNATFLPMLTRMQRANVSLVMWAMGATGVVTGMLTLGGAVSSVAMRLLVGTLAYIFIIVQRSRVERARAVAAAAQSHDPTPQEKPTLRSRQRRGGRKG